MPGSDSDADGTVAQRLSSGAQRLCERYGSRRPAAHRAVVCCALSRAYPLAERTERTPSRNGGGPAGGNAQLGALVGGKVLRAHACLSISKLAARGCSVCAAFGCWSHLDKIVFKKPRGFAKMRKRMASAKRSVSCSNTSRAENKTAQKHTEHGSPSPSVCSGGLQGKRVSLLYRDSLRAVPDTHSASDCRSPEGAPSCPEGASWKRGEAGAGEGSGLSVRLTLLVVALGVTAACSRGAEPGALVTPRRGGTRRLTSRLPS